MATAVIDAQRATPAGRWRGDDFAAWLPPMLVKELRQGLQSGVFLWTFLLFQAALFVLFSLWLLNQEVNAYARDPFTALFWLAAVTTVTVVVPLRGLGAIGGEHRGNALDLVRITRLSTSRIVVGKWVALFSQSFLVATTLLPYVVIRYYFGGVDVLRDLAGLGWILAAAAAVAAAAIALSTLPVWLRIGIGLAACGAAFFLFLAVVAPGGPLRSWAATSSPWQAQAGLLAALAVYTLACLEFAAARIAPSSENRALRQRSLALFVAAAWPLAGWLGSLEEFAATFFATAPLLGATAVGALVERPSRRRTLFAAFRRAGVPGRLAATVLTPGWASGLVFVAILAGVCFAGWLGYVQRFVPADHRPVAIAFAALTVAAIVSPLPFTAFLTRVRYPLLLYVLVQLSCFLAFVFANALKRYDVPWTDYAVGRVATLPFPTSAAISLAACRHRPSTQQQLAPTSTLAALAVMGLVLAATARPWMRELALGGRLLRGDAPADPTPTSAASVVVRPRSAAAAGPRVWRGDDFPCWLSPMLVRELRQGVQSGVFAWTFIGIQGAMFVLMALALGTFGGAPQGAQARDFAVMFWAAIAAAIVVVVPLRGLTAVSDERAATNLDLVRLTRLSATRIIVGKWAALVGQGLLVATALLPYLVVRYFFGGVNVIVDLELFGWMVAGSMAVAAGALALSTLPLWARIGIVVVVGIVGFIPAAGLLESVVRGRLTFAMLGAGGRLGILAGAGLATVTLLEYAAARIAPPAENHAGRMRLIALATAAAWAVVGVLGTKDVFTVTLLVGGPLLVCYAIGGLLEEPVPIAALHRPFGRWGVAGRLAAAVFTPGWATAVPFVAVVAGLWMAGWLLFFARTEPQNFAKSAAVGCLVTAAVIFPLPVLVHWPRIRQRLLLYALVQLSCFLVFVYVAAVGTVSANLVGSGRWWFTLPFPLAALPAFFAMMWQPHETTLLAPTFVAASAITSLVVLGLVARPWWREMRRTQRLVGSGTRP